MTMGCFRRCDNNGNGAQEGKHAVVLRFRRENLDYSIRNYAYIESHVMRDESECSKHMVADIGEEGNRDRVTRLLGVIHAGVIEMLYPYTKREAVEEIIDDDIWEPKEYVIVIHVPPTFSRTTCHLLSRLIHEYMVYRVLYDWLTITNKADTQAALHWLEKAEEAAGEIESIKNLRTGTLERPLRPW